MVCGLSTSHPLLGTHSSNGSQSKEKQMYTEILILRQTALRFSFSQQAGQTLNHFLDPCVDSQKRSPAASLLFLFLRATRWVCCVHSWRFLYTSKGVVPIVCKGCHGGEKATKLSKYSFLKPCRTVRAPPTTLRSFKDDRGQHLGPVQSFTHEDVYSPADDGGQ